MSIRDETQLTDELLDNDIRALFVDPVMDTFGGHVNINQNNEVRHYLAPYARIAKAIDGIVVGVAHMRKGQVHDLMECVTSSSAFVEVPRAVFGFASAGDGQHIMQQAKNSAGTTDLKLTYHLPLTEVACDDGNTAQLPRFEITGESTLSIADIYGEGEDTDPAMANADDVWLKDYLLLEQPAPSARVKLDAKEQADITTYRLHRARKRLGVKVLNQPRPDAAHTTVWCLPAGTGE
jgi:hypothetical protein